MQRGSRRFIVTLDVTMRHTCEVRVPRGATVEPQQWNELLDDAIEIGADGVDTKITALEEILPDGSHRTVSRYETITPLPRRKRTKPCQVPPTTNSPEKPKP